jgi:hypothetical protein
MVKEDMGLDASFFAPEFGPGKHGQTKGDGGGVQAHEFVFETKLALARAQLSRFSKA